MDKIHPRTSFYKYRAIRAEKNHRWSKALYFWDKFDVLHDERKLVGKARSLAHLGKFDAADKLLTNEINHFNNNLVDTKKTLSQDDLIHLLQITHERSEIVTLEKINSIDKQLDQIETYLSDNAKLKKNGSLKYKIAVFSAISKDYDQYRIPKDLDPRIDYFLFTDTLQNSYGFLNVRPMPYIHADPTRTSRYVKTHPHTLLSEYDFAIWVDANFMICGDLHQFVDSLIKSKKSFGCNRHPLRKSVWDEINACLSQNKGDRTDLIYQKEYLEKQRYQTDDLLETGFMVYDLRNARLKTFLNLWWKQIDTFSNRDQISVNYSLDRCDIKIHHFFNFPNSSRNNKLLALTKHEYSKTLSTLDKMIPRRTSPEYLSSPPEKLKSISTDVVVCVHNALNDVKLCLSSLSKFRKDGLYNLIIVDDGSDGPTSMYLRNFCNRNSEWAQLIRHTKAKGYTKAANRGMTSSKADFVVLLNSDTIVTKNSIKKMRDLAFSSEFIGIVGPLSSAASQQSIPSNKNTKNQTAVNTLPSGLTPDVINEFCEKINSNKLKPCVPFVHGFCIGIKQDVFNKIGYYDSSAFPRGYGEENDFCLRALDAGFELRIATDTYVFHSKSKSFKSHERLELMKNGMLMLKSKQGVNRVARAIKTMEIQPSLIDIRKKTDKLYKNHL